MYDTHCRWKGLGSLAETLLLTPSHEMESKHVADKRLPHLKFSLACRKFVRATSSMTGPRAQLMSVASFFIMFNLSSFSK